MLQLYHCRAYCGRFWVKKTFEQQMGLGASVLNNEDEELLSATSSPFSPLSRAANAKLPTPLGLRNIGGSENWNCTYCIPFIYRRGRCTSSDSHSGSVQGLLICQPSSRGKKSDLREPEGELRKHISNEEAPLDTCSLSPRLHRRLSVKRMQRIQSCYCCAAFSTMQFALEAAASRSVCGLSACI